MNKCRTVWILDDCVIKVDTTPWKDARVFRQTAREIELWESLEEDREHFAGILEFGRTGMGRWWIKQRKITPDRFVAEETWQKIKELSRKYKILDLWECNWFQVDGKAVIFDWGV